MISIIDLIVYNINKYFGNKDKTCEHEKQIIQWDDENIVWFVFLGWGVNVKTALKFHLIPFRGTAVIFETPYTLVNPDPHKTKQVFLKIIKEIDIYLKKHKSAEINVLSHSAGNAFGYFVANNYNTEKFIAVVTGARLGEEIFSGITTQDIKKRSLLCGFSNGHEYDQVLKGYLPIDNTKYLPKKSHVYLGRFDLFTPTCTGLEIYKKMKKYNNNTKLTLWPFGHIFSLFFWGILNRMKRIKIIYD
jgi:hypothetical protein